MTKLETIHMRGPDPIGDILIVTQADVVVAITFGLADERILRNLRTRFGEDVQLTACADYNHDAHAALRAYFDGDLYALQNLRADGGGSAFQRRVWAELRRIPPGETRSYGELARNLGNSGASRAVGLANGSNPINLVVPCHRVIGSNGKLTGYGPGLALKEWLLDFEARHAGKQPTLFPRYRT